MKYIKFQDKKGTFTIQSPENYSGLYFPLAGDGGLKSSITPNLGGDSKTDQNHFLLEPVSIENLHNNRSTRNFWCRIEGKGCWSATGISAEQELQKFTEAQDKSILEAGFMWQKVTRTSAKYGLQSEITSFVDVDGAAEIELVRIKNISEEVTKITPIAAIPLYGRSADNIRDHRHVTSLLHRINTTEYGVEVTPVLSFDERGHQKNHTTYFVYGYSEKGDAPEAFYPTVQEFIGEGGTYLNPEAVRKNKPGRMAGSRVEGKEAMGGIRFADVAGEDEAKENLQEVVNYLHDPSKYESIGAKMPKGILLVGPPGTGKTMLAKAVAGESNVPFFSISGSEFVEMFVGMGASKVRDLFKQAKEKAPCIVFIDEIDAIGQKRSGGQYGGNDEREQTLNQLLTEMDGFEGNTGVIILAATNRPESLDPALTRPGRFDRRVPVELPDLKGREEILKVHAKKVALAPGIDFTTVARMASGASGAELANIVNEAALRAVRAGRKSVTQSDLEESIEVVIAGYQKKNSILTDHEKCIVAYHEIGHALVAAKQTHSAPVQKITIIPRTSGALGYTMQVDEGNHYLMNKEELENKIATLTGGRAAEEVVFHSITTGASNDIEQATKLARAMLTRYGMSDEFDMVALETINNQYLGGDTSLACSAQTQCEIDQKVVELVKAQHAKAVQILTDNRAKLDELAQYLYQKETITGDEFMEILNREG